MRCTASTYHGTASRLFLLILIGLASGCTVQTINPDTVEELSIVRNVAIVPPSVFVGLSKFAADDERMPDKEAENLAAIQLILEEELQTLGYQVVDFDFAEEAGNNAEFAYLLTTFKEELALAAENSNSWAPIGDSAREISSRTGADALFYVDYVGIRKTSGQVAQDIGTGVLIGILTAGAVLPVSAQNAASASAHMIDGISGDILWRHSAMGSENPTIVKGFFKQLPAAGEIQ